MTPLLFFVDQIAFGLYILIAVAALRTYWGWSRSRRAYRSTYFELERDLARYHSANAVTVLILLVEAALIILGIQRIIVPTLRAGSSDVPTFETVIEDGIFVTPTPFALPNVPIDASGVQLEEIDPAEAVLVTPTLTPTPVGTIIPNADAPMGCKTPSESMGAMLQIPANGMVVFSPINIVGVAYTDNMSFYRFEIKGPSTFENFVPLEDHTEPVTEISPLGQFIPAFYEPGEYRFRLMVFDEQNIVDATCEVTIFISEPIPTPTPLGEGVNPGLAPVATAAAPG